MPSDGGSAATGAISNTAKLSFILTSILSLRNELFVNYVPFGVISTIWIQAKDNGEPTSLITYVSSMRIWMMTIVGCSRGRSRQSWRSLRRAEFAPEMTPQECPPRIPDKPIRVTQLVPIVGGHLSVCVA